MKQQEKKSQETPEADLARAAAESKADEQDRGRITSITIENFKGISNAVEIPIHPITLLFGKNSSGKSTVLQALRYHYFIRHTELESKIGYESNSQIEMVGGHNIDLADFRSLVHRHDLNRKIRVRITYAPKEEGEKSSILWEEVITGWRENTHPDKPKLENTHVESILLGYLIDNEEKCFIASGDKPDKVVNTLDLDENLDESLTLMRAGDDDFTKINLGMTIKKPKKLDAIRHLGPFREVPFDDDETPQMTDESRWEKGAGAWKALTQDSELLEKTNVYMQNVLKLRYSIKINQPQPQSTKLLHNEDNDIDIGLSDVGIGISQLIPVVIGALDNSQSSGIFAVEQPELHIHPALQVALGDMFIDAIKNNNRTILIETHSEHLLLRLLRRVRETNIRNSKKHEWRQTSISPLHREMSEAAIRDSENQDSQDHQLTPDHLSIVYVVPTSKGVKFIPLNVMDDGDFDGPWPEGFFDERVKELL